MHVSYHHKTSHDNLLNTSNDNQIDWILRRRYFCMDFLKPTKSLQCELHILLCNRNTISLKDLNEDKQNIILSHTPSY